MADEVALAMLSKGRSIPPTAKPLASCGDRTITSIICIRNVRDRIICTGANDPPNPALPATEAFRPTLPRKNPRNQKAPRAQARRALCYGSPAEAARTICFAPTPEMRLQMQIMRANPLRLASA